MDERTDLWPELGEMSRLVVELANVVVALLDAHETIAATQAQQMVRDARDLHHRIQAMGYQG